MKPTIGIITNDVLFENFFIPLLKTKANDIQILVCHEDHSAKDKIDKTICDIILLDGGITGISGIEVLRRLRTKDQVVSPIWYFSEIQTELYEHKAMSMGASRIINKPFDPIQIVDELLSALNK